MSSITASDSIIHYIHMLGSYHHINKTVLTNLERQVQIFRANVGSLGKLNIIGTFFKAKVSDFEHLFL